MQASDFDFRASGKEPVATPIVEEKTERGKHCTLEITIVIDAIYFKELIHNDRCLELIVVSFGTLNQQRFWIHKRLRYQQKKYHDYSEIRLIHTIPVAEYLYTVSKEGARSLVYLSNKGGAFEISRVVLGEKDSYRELK